MNKLRGYIAPAAPLNWEPMACDTPDFRCVIGFTCNWFNKRLGIDFSEKYHRDPVYRYEAVLKMKNHIRKCFPDIAYYKEHDRNGFEQECATISNMYGVCFFAMLYGMKPVFSVYNWPAVHPNDHLTVEQIKKLKPFDLKNHPLVEMLIAQMDEIEKQWGKIDGYLNCQGLLNNAFKIRGVDIFTDMLEDPGLCKHLFGHICDTMLQLLDIIRKRQYNYDLVDSSFVMSHCTVNMISPDDYMEFIYPHDRIFSWHFKHFGIHSCNWVLDPYIEKFSKINGICYIDCGFNSNLSKVREGFPEARRLVFYNPSFLVKKSREAVNNDIERICRELGPCDICLADIEVDIPDNEIAAFAHYIEGISSETCSNE